MKSYLHFLFCIFICFPFTVCCVYVCVLCLVGVGLGNFSCLFVLLVWACVCRVTWLFWFYDVAFLVEFLVTFCTKEKKANRIRGEPNVKICQYTKETTTEQKNTTEKKARKREVCLCETTHRKAKKKKKSDPEKCNKKFVCFACVCDARALRTCACVCFECALDFDVLYLRKRRCSSFQIHWLLTVGVATYEALRPA
jgi:hypothetical protein